MYIRAEFPAMELSVAELNKARATHEEYQNHQTMQARNSVDYWEDQSAERMNLAHLQWKKVAYNISEEVGKQSVDTNTCIGLYQSAVQRASSLFPA